MKMGMIGTSCCHMSCLVFVKFPKPPQVSFELLFGRQPRGLLNVAREAWEQQPTTIPPRTVVEHVQEMRQRIEKVMPLVREHMQEAQHAQQQTYKFLV